MFTPSIIDNPDERSAISWLWIVACDVILFLMAFA